MSALLIPLAVLTACTSGESAGPEVSPTEVPSVEPTAESTTVPAATPMPTATPEPAATATATSTPEPFPELPDGIVLPELTVPGPYEYPVRGLEQIDTQDLADVLWAYVQMVNSLAVGATARSLDAAQWYQANSEVLYGELVLANNVGLFNHSATTGEWAVSQDEATLDAVRVAYDDNESASGLMEFCVHISSETFNDEGSSIASTSGTGELFAQFASVDGNYKIVGLGNRGGEEGEFTGCPGFFDS